jgi:hypothetical protein
MFLTSVVGDNLQESKAPNFRNKIKSKQKESLSEYRLVPFNLVAKAAAVPRYAVPH